MVTLFCFLIILQGYHCATIHVSKMRNSSDCLECGTTVLPCRTLSFAILNISRNLDTIRIDGGYLNDLITYTYKVRNKILINKNLSITKYSTLNHNPIVSSTQGHVKNTHVFVINHNSTVTLNVTNIIFKGISFCVPETNAIINVKNCNMTNSKFAQFNIAKNINVSLHLFGCIFFNNSAGVYAAAYRSLTLTSKYCNFEGDPVTTFNTIGLNIAAKKNDSKTHLFLQNTTFQYLHSAIGLVFNSSTRNHFIYLEGCNFVENYPRQIFYHNRFTYYGSNIEILGPAVVTMKFCNFSGNVAKSGGAVHLKGVNKAVFFKCTFLNNTATIQGGACFFENSSKSIIIQNCTFVNNTAAEKYRFFTRYEYIISMKTGLGGAIANIGGLIVNGSIFIGNAATTYGGTIYHVYVENKVYVQEMQEYVFFKTSSTLSMYSSKIFGSVKKWCLLGDMIYAESKVSFTNMYMQALSAQRQTSLVYHSDDSVLKVDKKFQFECPVNHKLYTKENQMNSFMSSYGLFVLYCFPCEKGTYSVDYESYQSVDKNGALSVKKIKCLVCPSGGKCDSSVVSNDNFWGELSNKTVRFFPCPYRYCCSSYNRNCISYHTCSFNRGGILCGTCDQGYSDNIMSTGCIKNDNCFTPWFWVMFFIFAMLYVAVIMYLKEIVAFIKRLLKRCAFVEASQLQNKLLTESTANNGTMSLHAQDNVDETAQIQELDKEGMHLFAVIEDSVDAESESYIENQTRASGVFKILVFFYQIEFLIQVNASAKNNYFYHGLIKTALTSLFNLQVSSESNVVQVCAYVGMGPVGKDIVKVALPLSLIAILLFMFLCYFVNQKLFGYAERVQRNRNISFVDEDVPLLCKIPFDLRIKTALLQMLLLTYSAITRFSFQMINCVGIGDKHRLFINGNIECYQWWQYGIIAFITLWVIPFPFLLYIGNKLLRMCKVTSTGFLCGILFPPWMVVCAVKNERNQRYREAMYSKHMLFVMDGGFRKNPEKNEYVMWECALIFRRLLLTAIVIFILDPITRLYVLLVPLFIFVTNHIRVWPYKDKFLNWLEFISLMLLCFLCSLNLFWSYFYISDITITPSLYIAGKVVLLVELCILSLPLFVAILGIFFCFSKLFLKFYKYSISKQQ